MFRLCGDRGNNQVTGSVDPSSTSTCGRFSTTLPECTSTTAYKALFVVGAIMTLLSVMALLSNTSVDPSFSSIKDITTAGGTFFGTDGMTFSVFVFSLSGSAAAGGAIGWYVMSQRPETPAKAKASLQPPPKAAPAAQPLPQGQAADAAALAAPAAQPPAPVFDEAAAAAHILALEGQLSLREDALRQSTSERDAALAQVAALKEEQNSQNATRGDGRAPVASARGYRLTSASLLRRNHHTNTGSRSAFGSAPSAARDVRGRANDMSDATPRARAATDMPNWQFDNATWGLTPSDGSAAAAAGAQNPFASPANGAAAFSFSDSSAAAGAGSSGFGSFASDPNPAGDAFAGAPQSHSHSLDLTPPSDDDTAAGKDRQLLTGSPPNEAAPSPSGAEASDLSAAAAAAASDSL